MDVGRLVVIVVGCGSASSFRAWSSLSALTLDCPLLLTTGLILVFLSPLNPVGLFIPIGGGVDLGCGVLG